MSMSAPAHSIYPGLIGRMVVPFRLSLVGRAEEDLIGEEIPEWGGVAMSGGPAVQNPNDVDAVECDLLVNNIVAEEPGLPSSDSGRVAEVVEQCQRGPRRLRLQFAGSQATTVSASRDAPLQFESPATSAAHVAVGTDGGSIPVIITRPVPTSMVSEEQASGTAARNMCRSPRSVEAEAEEADEDIDVQFPRPSCPQGCISSRGRLELDRQVEETCFSDEECPPTV